MQLPRQLVASNMLARILLHRLQGQRCVATGRYHRRHPAAITLIRHTHYQAVENIRIGFQSLLDLLGKYLFPTGVDAVGAAAKDSDGIVLFQPGLVPQQQPGLAIHLDDGLRSLDRVVVVAHRYVAAAGEDAHFPRSHVAVRLALHIADHRHEIALGDIAQTLALLAATVQAHVAALRRAEGIADEHIGKVPLERLLLAG